MNTPTHTTKPCCNTSLHKQRRANPSHTHVPHTHAPKPCARPSFTRTCGKLS